jgi:hypothetical protein
MTAATTIERSGPAIRAALAEHSPEECGRFEAELRAALARAGDDFDLGPVERLLDRWWGVAAIRANPLSDRERDQLDRARRGDESGLLSRSEQGDWVRI